MAGFPILDLNPTLLEKLINKLEGADYFRLQQTCRDVMEFIQNSKKIRVCLDYTTLALWESGQFKLYSPRCTDLDIQSLYGTRVATLDLRKQSITGSHSSLDKMAGFALLDLCPTLLEKVVNKMHGKDYCRLQQTCRDMMEFIQNSKNISVRLDGYSHLCLQDGSHFSLFLGSEVPRNIDIQSLYGIRLLSMSLPDSAEGFPSVFDALKNYRITCGIIDIHDGKWTTEQYVELFNILNHTQVIIAFYQPKPFEALFQAKTLEGVQMQYLDPEMAVEVTERLLPSFSHVKIDIIRCKNNEIQPLYSIVKILCARDFPNLHSFEYSGYFTFDETNSFEEEVEKTVAEFNLTAQFASGYQRDLMFDEDDYFSHYQETTATIEIPHSSRRIVCKLADKGDLDPRFRINPIQCNYSIE